MSDLVILLIWVGTVFGIGILAGLRIAIELGPHHSWRDKHGCTHGENNE